jgi:iron complex transport system substrate-binding protein
VTITAPLRPPAAPLGVVTRSRSQPRLGPVTRRGFLHGAAGGAVLLGLTACADNDPTAGGAPTTTSPPPPAIRVVTLGQSVDPDALLALGITPVAMSAAFNQDSGFHPWTAAALGSRRVELIKDTDGLPFEQVAALKPDLILATTYNTTNNDYDTDRPRLEQIAKVIGPTTTAQRDTWQQSTLRVGEAVGLTNEAHRLIQNTEATLTAARDAHPDWKNKTYTNGPVTGPAEIWTSNSPQDTSAIVLGQLGLVLSPKVTTLTSPYPGWAQVSLEQLTILDADVIMLSYHSEENSTALETNPLFQQLPAVQRGAYIHLASDVSTGLAYPSVLSIPYVLDWITPRLTQALNTQ